ncbi:AAA family ATPase [Streptomyces sp. BPTC-684]|uniref:AAA family ATPase n=1 Tax=Streptomyces sp. BPTC-684 TaxID=3043734 RepID=UPI0024B285FF|nr:AAA family ATPase [Streptomyces sp. BPTC-684]WHM36022.1 AAA family ATPase [Streptomyces sp. BPTC-684]
MKLLKLTLKDFRAFYGEQVLDLSVREDKPAVLIFGNNGAGKTTLLNAFGWVLYGTFSDDVEQQHRVIHDKKWEETSFGEEATSSVRLDFEHEGIRFSATRGVTVNKQTEEQQTVSPSLTVTEVGPDGEAKSVPNGQDRIEKILPRGLRQFFFFNGERMEKMFSGDDNNEEVKKAIKTLLNLETIERAIADLPKASRLLARAIDSKGDTRLKQLTDRQEELAARAKAEEDEKLRHSAAISTFQKEVESIGRALRQNEQAEPLQKERERLTRRINQEKERLADHKSRKRELLSKHGFLALTGGLDDKVVELADRMRERRQLPAGIQRSFIEDILEEQLCMCGRSVEEGTPEYEELNKRKYNAGLEDVQHRWMHVSGEMRSMSDKRQELLEQLTLNASDIQKADAAISQLEAERSEVDRQLEGVNIQDVKRLVERRKECGDKETESRVAHRESENRIALIEQELVSVARQYKSAAAKNEESRRIQTQVGLVESVRNALIEILTIKTEEVRDQLDKKVKEVFSRIFIKSYIPELNDSFELELRAPSGVAIRSTGENQILGLSFVGAVSEVARSINARKSHADEATIESSGSGVYPVVMDAPFGSLDLTYQEEISKALPALTSQIVTLLSQSQARGNVMENLQHAANRMYVLRSFTPNRAAEEETIEINNRAVPYVSYGAFEYTVLEEVTV